MQARRQRRPAAYDEDMVITFILTRSKIGRRWCDLGKSFELWEVKLQSHS